MDKIKCGVIQDLIPLYIDEISSEETNKLIEEHIATCDSCKKDLDRLRENLNKETMTPIISEDENIIKSLRRAVRRKQIIIAIVVAIMAGIITLVGMKIYIESQRPDINGNEMILSRAIATDGTPENILQNKGNGVEVLKEGGTVYLSLPVNNKKMEECHVRLLLDNNEVEDMMLKVSDARYVTYCMDNLDGKEKGMYVLEYYDLKNQINQYKWFTIK